MRVVCQWCLAVIVTLATGSCYPDKPTPDKDVSQEVGDQLVNGYPDKPTPDKPKYIAALPQDRWTAEQLLRLRNQLKRLLTEPEDRILINPVVRNAETAVAIAEALAFDALGGPTEIVPERPYNAMLLDGYWIVTGTLPKGYVGGTFEVILDAKDGRVVRLWHGE